ncbi:MAG TPA: hydrogenase nickel incorporation protein HypB [Balneolales bacterium]|nr:hydrogenase nickel incorporation protein HypB [Balneolales bacterium]
MSIKTIERKVLQKNDEVAGENRSFFERKGIFALNLVSSPGSGKTSLLEQTLKNLESRAIKPAVVIGDVQTSLDAERLQSFDIPVIQLVTNGACHLEAMLVRDALTDIQPDQTELLFIENVGNLVCPAGFDLGEAMKVVIASTTEGDDKPLKYPAMFRNAKVLVINKTDLLPYVNCNMDQLRENALRINPSLTIFETSCVNGDGIDQWCDWLARQVKERTWQNVSG